jgi:asparagine synthase (glutamine-hydrolysing)
MIQNYASANATYFCGIQSLPPGCLLTVDRGKEYNPSIKPFFRHIHIGMNTPNRALKLSDVADNLHSLLFSAIEEQTAGEYRCDFALSGGPDSAALVTIAKKILAIHAHVVTDAEDNQDYLSASNIASYLQISLKRTQFSYEEYLASLPAAIWIEERPSSFSAAPLQFLAKSVSVNAKIILSGEGADEVFGGYQCYVEGAHAAKERLAKVKRLDRIGLLPREETVEAALHESQASSPEEYAERILERIFWGRLQSNHLELVDRYFMAYGVECRVPYLQKDLVSYITSLPLSYRIDFANGIQKVALKCLLASQSPTLAFCSLRRKQGLPGAALQHSQRLCSEIVRYMPQFNTQLANKIKISGIRALAWDLFHAIFFDGKGSSPDTNLVHQLVLDQKIKLKGSTV